MLSQFNDVIFTIKYNYTRVFFREHIFKIVSGLVLSPTILSNTLEFPVSRCCNVTKLFYLTYKCLTVHKYVSGQYVVYKHDVAVMIIYIETQSI